MLHVSSVSRIVALKYSLNIQKPLSLKCENIRLPAPVARTISSGCTLLCATIGASTPAAVIPATVAEPIDARSSAATPNARMSGLTWIFPAWCVM